MWEAKREDENEYKVQRTYPKYKKAKAKPTSGVASQEIRELYIDEEYVIRKGHYFFLKDDNKITKCRIIWFTTPLKGNLDYYLWDNLNFL